MLKVLYLPLGQQPSVYDAWNNVGVQFESFDFFGMHQANISHDRINQLFIEKVQQFQPQLIHMQLQITNIITAESLMKARKLSPGVIISNWSGDIRGYVIHELNSLTSVVDYTLISNTGQLDLYRRAGCNNIKYWQIGYDPKIFCPLNYTEFNYDVSFVGNNYGNIFPDSPLRVQAVATCTNNFGGRFGIFGGGWANNCHQIEPPKANEIYNKSVCALSISNFNSVAHYFSDRLLYCLASGRPTIAWYFPGAENYFIEGSEIFYARSHQDIVNIVNYCKSNPKEATLVGMNGQKRVFKEHTYTSRIIELLHMTNLIDKV